MEEVYMEMLSESNPITINTPSQVSSNNMKYGYVTVEYNTEEVWFEDVWRYLGYENVGPKDRIAIEFEKDNSNPNKLCVYDTELVHCENISACDITYLQTTCPMYFYHKIYSESKFYDYKVPISEPSLWGPIYRLGFKQFNSYPTLKIQK